MLNKKKTPIAVFNILKSVMDAKAKLLNEQLDAGRRATAELPIMKEHISALRQVILNCRTFDPSERREAEEDLEDKELQLVGIQNRIERGQRAEQELKLVQQFNTDYISICKMHLNAPRIHELNDLFYELCERQYRLDEKIIACEINMDAASRLPGFVEQARIDAAKYSEEYNDLEKRKSEIRKQIEELQR